MFCKIFDIKTIPILFFLLISCSISENLTKDDKEIEDLKKIPQNALFFASKYKEEPDLLPEFYNYLIQYYLSRYFEPWSFDYKVPEIEIFYKSLLKGEYYGENIQRINKSIIERIIKNSQIEKYPSLSKEAITIKTTPLRALPTKKPFFKDFSKPGEGYPFDYVQLSTVYGNTPIRILHITEDKEWVFAVGIFGFGWIQTSDIAFVNQTIINKMVNNKEWIVIIKDETPIILSENSNFLYKTHIGSIFPLIKEEVNNFIAEVVVSNEKKEAVLKEVVISKNASSRGFLPLKRENIGLIINNMIGQPYGWGGLYENRDCSGTMKDLFAVFGIYLPRNSFNQFQSGIHAYINKISNNTKEETIKKYGLPFYTLIWAPGHIMLYIGEFENKVVVFHNIWGIKTITNNKEDRKIIGKAVITTLEPGKEIENIQTTFLERVRGITNIIPPLSIQRTLIKDK